MHVRWIVQLVFIPYVRVLLCVICVIARTHVCWLSVVFCFYFFCFFFSFVSLFSFLFSLFSLPFFLFPFSFFFFALTSCLRFDLGLFVFISSYEVLFFLLLSCMPFFFFFIISSIFYCLGRHELLFIDTYASVLSTYRLHCLHICSSPLTRHQYMHILDYGGGVMLNMEVRNMSSRTHSLSHAHTHSHTHHHHSAEEGGDAPLRF